MKTAARLRRAHDQRVGIGNYTVTTDTTVVPCRTPSRCLLSVIPFGIAVLLHILARLLWYQYYTIYVIIYH